MLSLDMLVDVFFLLDVVLNFHTGVIIEHVRHPRGMAADPAQLTQGAAAPAHQVPATAGGLASTCPDRQHWPSTPNPAACQGMCRQFSRRSHPLSRAYDYGVTALLCGLGPRTSDGTRCRLWGPLLT